MSGLPEDEVVEYLREHPDFFISHQSLLTDLNLPHTSGRTISLVERQVEILRERNMEMRRQLNDLLQRARDNDTLFTKTRTLTLSLLDAANLQELNEVLATHVLVDFDADFVCCHLAGASNGGALDHFRWHNQSEEISAGFSHLFSGKTSVCTSLRSHELANIFPNSTTDESGSAVLLTLETQPCEGILAIGSRDPGRFSNDMDTLFVTYIADILSKSINRLTQ